MDLNANISSQRRPQSNYPAYVTINNGQDTYKVNYKRADQLAEKVRLRKKHALRCRLQKDAIEYRLNNGIDIKNERKAERKAAKVAKVQFVELKKRNRIANRKRK